MAHRSGPASGIRRRFPDRHYIWIAFWAGSALLILAAEARAIDWRFTPRITVREVYSDNINIAPDGREESDFVTDVRPSFSLRGEGRRFFFDLFYGFQWLTYLRDTSDDRYNHQLRGTGTAELVDDLFFLDLGSSVSQQNVDTAGRIADDTVTVTDNTTDVLTFSMSPYLRQRFGNVMDGELRYTYDRVERSNVSDDSETNTYFAQLVSGADFERLTWNLYGRRIDQDRERSGQALFDRAELTGRYRFTRKYAFIFGGGYEAIEFDSPPRDDDDVTWRLGVSLTPTPRTLLEGGAEGRVFGVAPFVTARHRSRRTVITLSYTEDITTTDRIISEREFLPLVDAFGDPILDPDSGEVVRIPIDTPSQTNEVLVNKRFDASISARGLRTTATLSAFDVRRDFEVSPGEEVYGVNLSVGRQLSRPMQARAFGSWSRSEFDDPLTEDRNRWTIGVGLDRQFARDFSGSIDARHISQTSDNSNVEYDENRVSIIVTKQF